MRCMFTMMNNARLAVGNEGLGLAERAYQQALAYPQRARPGQARMERGHPAAYLGYRTCAACRCYAGPDRGDARALLLDRRRRRPQPAGSRARTAPAAARSAGVADTDGQGWCTDSAQEIATAAVQVHGGMGFIEETGAAQHFRDARIAPIYEGTNGIQALDLVGRKLKHGRR